MPGKHANDNWRSEALIEILEMREMRAHDGTWSDIRLESAEPDTLSVGDGEEPPVEEPHDDASDTDLTDMECA
jgi:hypothetical protein